MSKRIVFIITIGSAAIAGAATMAIVQPFGSEATTQATHSALSAKNAVLSELKPGAKLEARADGSLSFTGPLTDEAAAEAKHINEISEAGPGVVSCTGSGNQVACAPVAEEAVIPALNRGQELYGRTVYGDVSNAVGRGVPVLERDDLVCGPITGPAITCSPAGKVQPTIEAGQKTFVVYRLYRATFDAQGRMSLGRAAPEVPLVAK